MITGKQLIIAIALMSAVTFSTRALPFLVFGSGKKEPPALVLYLGKYLPPAIICAILVYCFRDVQFTQWPFAIREVVAAGLVVGLHVWKRNPMLSIFSGTAVYMLMTQYIS